MTLQAWELISYRLEYKFDNIKVLTLSLTLRLYLYHDLMVGVFMHKEWEVNNLENPLTPTKEVHFAHIYIF